MGVFTLMLMGHCTESEVNTSNGRLDCVVQNPNHIYILEFKLDQSAEAVLAQIKERGKAIPKIETCTHGRSESRKSDIIRETNFLIKPYAEKYALDPSPQDSARHQFPPY